MAVQCLVSLSLKVKKNKTLSLCDSATLQLCNLFKKKQTYKPDSVLSELVSESDTN